MPMNHERVDYYLTQLASEACEIGHAATKCIQFGFDHEYEGYGVNSNVLAQEVGDLLGTLDGLPVDWGIVATARGLKIAKIERVRLETAQAKLRKEETK